MGINLTCPQCSQQMSMDMTAGMVVCKNCGFSPWEADTSLEDKQLEVKRKGQRPIVKITHIGQIVPAARSAYFTGHDYLFDGNKEQARAAFQRAIDLQRDFVDPHLWLAEIAEDEKTKRDHLSFVLAYQPNHPDAVRQLMILNGRLTPEQAARTYHADEPEIKRLERPLETTTSVLSCPVCGGDLTVDDEAGRVVCRFCGYNGVCQPQRGAGEDSLTMALLERKANPVRWIIGERLLHCNNCGAERTIDKLSTRCPFCGSNHVIAEDALQSFQQPDGLIPFTVSQAQAGAKIKASLGSIGERFMGLFEDNRIDRATLDGYYLPFWVFDATVEVTRTTASPKRGLYERTTLNDGQYDVMVCAVTSPPPALTTRLGNFDMHQVVAYDPRLLAKYPAELYNVDFDRASLDARGIISKTMRQKHGGQPYKEEVTVSVFSAVTQMSFQLVLMPVWVATLIEKDGDIRTALVNGQTGKSVLGKAQKPRS